MPFDNSKTGPAAATRSVRWMCGAGHFIFGWSAEEDAKAERLIQQKMDEGVTFWITRNTWRGDRRVALTTVNDLPSDRRLIIEDDDIRAFLESSADAGVLPDDNDEDVFAEPPRRTKSAKEAAQNDTIAHRPLVGG